MDQNRFDPRSSAYHSTEFRPRLSSTRIADMLIQVLCLSIGGLILLLSFFWWALPTLLRPLNEKLAAAGLQPLKFGSDIWRERFDNLSRSLSVGFDIAQIHVGFADVVCLSLPLVIVIYMRVSRR